MMKTCFDRTRRLACCIVFVVCLLPVLIAHGEDDVDRDFTFASGLVELGFSDFADKVVQQVLRLHPDQKDRAKLIQAEILISRRKFTEAEGLVKELGEGNPKAQAIGLALARGYYRLGEMQKAKDLYNNFFKQYEGRIPTDPDLLRFYQDSAYQFGQMLEASGDMEGAVKAYGRVIATTQDKQTKRRLMAEQAAGYARLAETAGGDQRAKHIAAAKKLCEEIQWGGLDIWFGQSIITMANLELIKGDKAAARKVLESNMDLLKEVDQFIQAEGLPMSVSPMAGARFVLGELIQQDADALEKSKGQSDEVVEQLGKALGEFYNVFARYSGSDWGPEAGVRAQAIKARLEKDYGKQVKIPLDTAQAANISASQFRLAENLFAQKQYADAAKEFLKVLNQFPETEVSIGSLGTLGQCYARLDDELYVRMVTEYLGERFAGNPTAAKGLLGLGLHYFNQTNVPMYFYVYENYLNHFPKDDRAAGVLYTLAGIRKKAGDEQEANKYFQRIVEHYKQDQYYPKALSQLAWGAFAAGDYPTAIMGFTNYIAEAQPSPDKARAQLSLAESYRQLGQFREAAREYQTVVQWLTPANNPYATSAADAAKNRELLEKAVFQLSYCFARLKEPPESIRDFRTRAIKSYDYFVANFPQSKLAPKALSMKGAVQMEIADPNAAQTYEELAKKYPDSDEGRNALFSLVSSALEINQTDQARKAFAKMMESPQTYSAEEFSRVGQAMLDAQLYPEAARAFEQVTKLSTERQLLERSLFGLGSAQFALQNYPEAVTALEELMTKYPKSGLFYDAKFMMGTAYQKVDRLDDAQAALSDVFKYADNPLLINQASMDFGEIQIKKGDQIGALASYQRVALLGDATKPEIRPLVEAAIQKAIELAGELGRYDDVVDSCDQFIQQFSSSPKIESIRRVRADAKLKAAQQALLTPATNSPTAK